MKIKIWWPLLFVCLVVAASVFVFPSELRLADLLSDAGKLDDAVTTYRSLLEKYPHRDDLRIQLCRLYLLQDQPEQASAELQKIDPDFEFDLRFLHQLADIFSALQDKENTIRALERIVQQTPDDLAYRMKLAEAYQWNQQNRQAMDLYDEILAQQPDNDELLQRLVGLSLAERDYARSRNYLLRRLDRVPGDLASRKLLADVYLAENRRKAAAFEMEKILKQERNNRQLRVKLAELYLWMGERDRGRHHYEYLVRTHPQNAAYFDKFIALTERSDPQKALKYYKKRLTIRPDDTALRSRFVTYARDVGYIPEAIAAGEALVATHPGYGEYQRQLAYLYDDAGEFESAEDAFWRLFDIRGYEREAFDKLRAYYEEQQDYAKLSDLLAQADKKDILDVAGHKRLIDILTARNQYEAATEQAAKLLQRSPDAWDVRIKLAGLYLLNDETPRAVAVIRAGSRYHADVEPFLLYAALFFQKQKLHAQSIQSLQDLVKLDPQNVQYKKLLLEQYITVQDFHHADTLFREMLRAEPNDVRLRLDYASMYWLKGDFPKMKSFLDELVSARSADVNVQAEIGRFYFERGFYDQSIEYFSAVLATAPEDSASLRMLGLAYAWNNRPAEARTVLDRYHRLFTPDVTTLFQSALLLHLEGEKKEAQEQFRRVLQLTTNAGNTRDALLVRAKALAYLGRRAAAMETFDRLKRENPDDPSLAIDYAEGLIELKDYDAAERQLAEFLRQEPDDYRALRLLSTLHFQRGQYTQSAKLLQTLAQTHVTDSGLLLDLSDAERAAGNWVGSSSVLKNLLRRFPQNWPAQDRLMRLRRERSQRFATAYAYEKQTDDIFRQTFNAVLSKAAGWLAFTFTAGQDLYSSDDPLLGDRTYTNLEARATSSFRSKLQASVSAKTQQNSSDWFFTPSAGIRWRFNQTNSVALTATHNDLWFDPFRSAFFQGRVNRLTTDLNLWLYKKIVLWSRLTYESHKINRDEPFGTSSRANVQLGYQWAGDPALMTYYQFYHLNFNYKTPQGPDQISIPEDDTIHYLGAAYSQQWTRKLFTNVVGSVGYNTVQTAPVYYGVMDLEYRFLNNLTFKTQFSYGSQDQLNRDEKSLKLLFDISYFY